MCAIGRGRYRRPDFGLYVRLDLRLVGIWIFPHGDGATRGCERFVDDGERNHRAFADGLKAIGLSLLPPKGEGLWTLNAVRVPDGIDEAAVRQHLLDEYSIEIGAGLGPMAGKAWRIGLMGHGATVRNVDLVLAALKEILR